MSKERLRFVGKRIGLAGAALGVAWVMSFGVDQKPIVVAEAQKADSTATPAGPVIPDAAATTRAILTAIPTGTPVPPATPTPTEAPRPNAVGTQIGETIGTLKSFAELGQAIDSLRNPPPAAVPPPPQSPPGVLIVPQQVVKPETVVCEPKIVEIPKPVIQEVEVTPIPNPNVVPLRLDQLNAERQKAREEGAAEAQAKAEEELKACRAAQELARKAEVDAKAAVIEAANRYPWGTLIAGGLIGGVVGLGIGAIIFSRRTIVERFYHHYHP